MIHAAASHTCNEQGTLKEIKHLCRNSLRQNHFSKIGWRHCDLRVMDFPMEEATQDKRENRDSAEQTEQWKIT